AVEGATLRRLKRSWVSTITSACALAIAVSLMALSDGSLPGVAPERVLNLGAGPRVDHSGDGTATFAPDQPRVTPTPTTVTTPTTVASIGQAALASTSGAALSVTVAGVQDTTTTPTTGAKATVSSTTTPTTDGGATLAGGGDGATAASVCTDSNGHIQKVDA